MIRVTGIQRSGYGFKVQTHVDAVGIEVTEDRVLVLRKNKQKTTFLLREWDVRISTDDPLDGVELLKHMEQA